MAARYGTLLYVVCEKQYFRDFVYHIFHYCNKVSMSYIHYVFTTFLETNDINNLNEPMLHAFGQTRDNRFTIRNLTICMYLTTILYGIICALTDM